MLQKLDIQNYILIDELSIDLSKQLSVITGETGAGKSIIMGALGLILGDRADSTVCRNPEKKCFIEGTFHLSNTHQYKTFFEENDIDLSDELIIRREISAQGKSRAFINDTPINLNELKQLKIGRDKFIDILRANHLLILPKRSYRITTNSHHRFRKYKNQLVDLQISQPEQVWVSDITYIGKREKPCYLSLITDAYSKKIVGYNVSDNLNTQSSLVALRLAIKQRKNKQMPLIHHSDRGLQYCANEYQQILYKNGIQPSMTQNSDPYENAVAERINGILKQEFREKFIYGKSN